MKPETILSLIAQLRESAEQFDPNTKRLPADTFWAMYLSPSPSQSLSLGSGISAAVLFRKAKETTATRQALEEYMAFAEKRYESIRNSDAQWRQQVFQALIP